MGRSKSRYRGPKLSMMTPAASTRYSWPRSRATASGVRSTIRTCTVDGSTRQSSALSTHGDASSRRRYCSRFDAQHALSAQARRGARRRRRRRAARCRCIDDAIDPEAPAASSQRAGQARRPARAPAARRRPSTRPRTSSRASCGAVPGATSDRRNRLSAGTGMPAAAGGSPRRIGGSVSAHDALLVQRSQDAIADGADRSGARASGRDRRAAPARGRARARRQRPARPADRARAGASASASASSVAPGIGASPAA